MQITWRKIGAAIGSILVLGSTLGAAALAQDSQNTLTDLGSYKDLMISSDGTVSGLFVVGTNGASADVVAAINMAGWVSNQRVEVPDDEKKEISEFPEGVTGGEVFLTPIETKTIGFTRHAQFDNNASNAFEFGASHTDGGRTDKIGPLGYATGDGVVDFLYSYKDKGPLYFNGTEYRWHEELGVSLGAINASRDNLADAEGDQYDEVVIKVAANALTYKLQFDKAFENADLGTILKGKKVWFMGGEYTVISADTTKIKLAASSAEVILSSTNSKAKIDEVEVELGGIYSIGTSGAYKAKLTVTNNGATETKYVASGATEIVAGIEFFVKNAVVTTAGTNEGEAQIVVGAGILKIIDNDYLKNGAGDETTWRVNIRNATGGEVGLTIIANETQSYQNLGGTYGALRPGDSILAPNEFTSFTFTFNGPTDEKGNALNWRTVYFIPELRTLQGTAERDTIRIKSIEGDFIYYNNTYYTNDIWVNVSRNTTDNSGDGSVWLIRDRTTDAVSWKEAENIKIKASTGKDYVLRWTAMDQGGFLTVESPNLTQTGSDGGQDNITLIYNINSDKFDSVNGSSYFAYNQPFNALSGNIRSDTWFGRSTNITPFTRPYFTKWGAFASCRVCVSATGVVSGVNQQLVTIRFPEGQAYAEVVVGTQLTVGGKPVAVKDQTSATVGTAAISIEKAVSDKRVSLPESLAKLDTEVTENDKSTYVLVLVGGPKVNQMVNDLQTNQKLAKTIGAGEDISEKGTGVIELVEDAWGTGKYAIVVAGADKDGTTKAAQILAQFDSNSEALKGTTVYEVY